MNKILTEMSFIWFGLYLIALILIRWRPTGTSNYSIFNERFSDEDAHEWLSEDSGEVKSPDKNSHLHVHQNSLWNIAMMAAGQASSKPIFGA